LLVRSDSQAENALNVVAAERRSSGTQSGSFIAEISLVSDPAAWAVVGSHWDEAQSGFRVRPKADNHSSVLAPDGGELY
jgi:hypothetical protein